MTGPNKTPPNKFGYPETPNKYRTGEFVYCEYRDQHNLHAEGFGVIYNFIPPDNYVVELTDEKGYIRIPVKNIRKAGQA